MSTSSARSLFCSLTQESPFSQSLTLQLLISELIKSHKELMNGNFQHLYSTTPQLFPYDWACKMGHLTQFHLYSQPLGDLFPSCEKIVIELDKIVLKTVSLCREKKLKKIKQQLQLILTTLEPLITHCRLDENLFLFLLKNGEAINSLMHTSYLYDFLIKIHPEGLEVVGEKLCDQYHRRGFFSPISECKLLLTQLLHERSPASACL